MKYILGIAVFIGGAGVAYWLLSPLWVDTRVDEPLPVTALESPTTTITATPVVPVVTPQNTPATTSNTGLGTQTPITPTQSSASLVNLSAPIVGTPAHPARGIVRAVLSGDTTVIRYEDYDGTNGPDLHVYLATDLDASEYIDLGKAKGNQGNINYTVPPGVDLAQYPYVLTWCKAFGVLFDSAKLTSQSN